MDLIEQLKARVEECDRIIARAKDERATFMAALELEKRKRGGKKQPRRVSISGKSKINPPKFYGGGLPVSLPLVPVDATGRSEKKTDVFRRFIKDHPGLPKQAVMSYGNRNIPGANKNFGYTTMAKLVNRGEIEIRDGDKVFLAQNVAKKLEAANVAAS